MATKEMLYPLFSLFHSLFYHHFLPFTVSTVIYRPFGRALCSISVVFGKIPPITIELSLLFILLFITIMLPSQMVKYQKNTGKNRPMYAENALGIYKFFLSCF